MKKTMLLTIFTFLSCSPVKQYKASFECNPVYEYQDFLIEKVDMLAKDCYSADDLIDIILQTK
jgi:hypothetical protein